MSQFADEAKMKSLKRRASVAAKRRGHKLKRFMGLHSWSAVADCEHENCHASVYCRLKPAPNETEISGLAVAVNCGSQECTHTAKHLAPPYGQEG